MKCQKCPNAATLHITEIMSEDSIEELHLCEGCAQKYLYEPQNKQAGGKHAAPPGAFTTGPTSGLGHGAAEEEGSGSPQRECEICGIKFVDFRNTGRLGCPHDYQAFKEELTPLLENIHGEVKHVGKVPRRLPQARQTQSELAQLRKQLLQAVNKEHYEEAARLRDRIRQLEES
jgi:protein arginine kinase activator